jgi:hypothetical protein
VGTEGANPAKLLAAEAKLSGKRTLCQNILWKAPNQAHRRGKPRPAGRISQVSDRGTQRIVAACFFIVRHFTGK